MTARIIADLPDAAYRQLPGLSWSVLRHAVTSARHYQVARDGGLSRSSDMSAFHAQHAAVLEPLTFTDRYRPWTATTQRRGAAYDAACAAEPGVTWLTPSDYDTARAVAEAVSAHAAAVEVLTAPPGAHGWSEVTLTWEEGGRAMRGRLDRLVWEPQRRRIVDAKAVPSLHPRKMAAWIARQLYHGQLAHYAAGVRAVERARGLAHAPIDCYLVAYETAPIVDVGVYHLGTWGADGPDGALYCGSAVRAEALARVAEAEAAGSYPGQAPGVVHVELPVWAYGDDEDDAQEVYRE